MIMEHVMFRVYIPVMFLCFFIPFMAFSEPVSKCYSADRFLLKTSYEKSSKQKYGINHQLFVSYKQSSEKLSLNGDVVLDDEGKLKGVLYKSDDMSYFITGNGKQIILNDKETKDIKESECFSFLASYDSIANEKGDVVSIFSYGKDFKAEKMKNSFSPSFDCDKAEFPIEKAICASNEIAYMDRLFHSMKACYQKKAKSLSDNEAVEQIEKIADDFILYRNNVYRSNKDNFTDKEDAEIKKAYSLGVMFLPMTIAADNGDLRVLGRDLFMSYYMLSMQGVKYSGNYDKGLGKSYIVKDTFGKYYDEVMFYYSGVYDNMNSRLSSLFYYTVYLLEQHNMADKDGNFICR